MGEFACLHDACGCSEHEGEYCSEWCREAPECACNHPGCEGTS